MTFARPHPYEDPTLARMARFERRGVRSSTRPGLLSFRSHRPHRPGFGPRLRAVPHLERAGPLVRSEPSRRDLSTFAASRNVTRVRVPPRNYPVATPPGYRRKLTSPLTGNLPVAASFVNEKIHKILRLSSLPTTSPCGSLFAHRFVEVRQSRVSEHESGWSQTVFLARGDRRTGRPDRRLGD